MNWPATQKKDQRIRESLDEERNQETRSMSKRGGKHHSAEQIVRKLRDAEALLSSGKTIGEACQVLEVSEQTYFRWKKKYGGMKAEEAKRLEELEQENGRLKKLVADLSLDVQMLKEIARGNF